MRTLTFGDRTISYDAGLDTINTEEATTGSKGLKKNKHSKVLVSCSDRVAVISCQKLSLAVISGQKLS